MYWCFWEGGGIETNNNTSTVLRNRRPLGKFVNNGSPHMTIGPRAYTGFFRGLGPDYIAVTAGAKAHFVKERADCRFVDQK